MLAVLIVDNKFHLSSMVQPLYYKYFQVAYSHQQIFMPRAAHLSSDFAKLEVPKRIITQRSLTLSNKSADINAISAQL